MRRKSMKKVILLCLSIVLLVISAACTSKATTTTSTRATASNITPSRPVQTTTSTTAVPATVSPALHVTATGRLSFVQDTKLTFGTSGQVIQVSVNELDKVTKGQVLARLDTSSLEATVKAAELAEKSAEFAREQAGYSVQSAVADNNTMQENVKSAGIDLEQARDNLRKITYPYTFTTVYIDVPEALGSINDAMFLIINAETALKAEQYNEVASLLQQALNTITSSYNLLNRKGYGIDVFANQNLPMDKFWTLRTAEFQVNKAQVAVENAQNAASKTAIAVENAKTARAKADNDVAIAQNNLNIARDALQKAIITAPFNGVIGAVNVKVFDLLSSATYATTTAIEIIDSSRMELNINVNELDIPNVKVGQKVTITVDALPGARVDGTVASVGTLPFADSGLVSYAVKIVFDMPQNSALKAGMNARADIVIDKR
jgi:multidrug efflux pump subunit AcrA (membrane-fusion protein)